MTTPSSDQPITGVWVSPAGTRMEITTEGDGWRTYLYMTRTGGTPGAVHDFNDADKVQDAIAGLEQDGYVRQAGREPDGPRTLGENVAHQWQSPAQWIGALIVLAIAVVVIVALSSGG